VSETGAAGGYLLDTHIVLFALERPERLSKAAVAALRSGPNRISVVSYWEVVLKSMKGLLDVGDPRLWWQDTLDQLAARPLPLEPQHVHALAALPPHHRDPFDRILMAQAMAGGLTLISSDAWVAHYDLPALRIVR
jgi:PIN domain nuclease of toxin-antitoxin system